MTLPRCEYKPEAGRLVACRFRYLNSNSLQLYKTYNTRKSILITVKSPRKHVYDHSLFSYAAHANLQERERERERVCAYVFHSCSIVILFLPISDFSFGPFETFSRLSQTSGKSPRHKRILHGRRRRRRRCWWSS